MEQIGACPVKYGHEVIADGMDALSCQVAQTLAIDADLLVAVRTTIFNCLSDRKRLYYAPSHAVRLDVSLQVVDLLLCPYLSEGHIVQSRDNALDANLPKHVERNGVFTAKPSPCSFHF